MRSPVTGPHLEPLRTRIEEFDVTVASTAAYLRGLWPELEGVVYESRGRHELRNVREPVEIFAALQAGREADRLPVDPVCHMAVDPDRAPGRLLYDGRVYFFCSLSCAGEFARQPERFS